MKGEVGDHLEVVDADTFLQQVVSLLIVDHQDVLTPRHLQEIVAG